MTGAAAPSFDLLANPFALLCVRMTAGPREIEDAFGDAVSDEVAPEQDLQRARQILLTPRIRLAAEVSYLPDVEPGVVEGILAVLRSPSFLSGAAATASKLHSLPRSNVLTHLHARAPGDGSALAALLQAQAAAAPGAVLDAINDARETAGMVKADREAVAQALRDLFEAQDKAVLATFDDPEIAANAVSEAVTPLLEGADTALSERLDVFMAAYGQASDSELSRRLEAVRAACEHLKESPKDSGPADALVRSLEAWSTVGRPLQTLEEHKGRDDPRAREVFGEVRQLYLWVANEHGLYSLSEKILWASIRAFARLPRATEQMAEDLEILQGNLAFEPFRPLVDYIEELKRSLTGLDADLRRSGFGAQATGKAKQLFELFSAAVAGTKGTDLSDAPWRAIRDLAIALNNELDAQQGALALLSGTLQYASRHPPSPDVHDRLKADKRDVEGIVAQRELADHVKEGRHDEASTLVDRLLSDTQGSADERDFLLKVRAGLEHQKAQKNKRRATRLFWGAAAIGGVILLLVNQNPGPGRTPYVPPYPTQPAPVQPSNVATQNPAPAAPIQIDAEDMPPPGDGSRLFTVAQIRYCLFQDVRLETIRASLSDDQDDVARFNSMIGDWNSRCSRYRYLENDLTSAQASLAWKRSDLEAEGRRIAASMPSRLWTKPSSVPAASSRTYTPVQTIPAAAPQPATATEPAPVKPLPPPIEVSQAPRVAAIASDDRPVDLATAEGATRVQQRLTDLGFFSGIVDGMWGPRSRTALRDFKMRNGLTHDDMWDGRTEGAVFSEGARHASGSLTSKTDRWTPTDYPPPPGSSINPLNRLDAARLQRRLSDLGFYGGSGDGVWGLASRYALRDFKVVNGLVGDDSWDAQVEHALFGPAATRADETVIGVWARDPSYCAAPGGETSSSLRITSYELEGLGRSCKVLGLSRSANNWMVTAQCPSGTGNLRYVLSNGRLYREEDMLRFAYIRCSTR